MYKFNDMTSACTNTGYPIIQFMYTVVKMLIKIDNPTNLWWSSIYMGFIQNGGQNADTLNQLNKFGTFTAVATKKK